MKEMGHPRGHQLIRADRLFWTGGVPFARVFEERFQRVLDRIDQRLTQGAIEIVLPDGTRRLLGGVGKGPIAHVALNSWKPLVRLWFAGSVGWYRGWAEKEWTSPDPVPLFDLFMRNRGTLGDIGRAHGIARFINRLAHGLRRNSRARARTNIHAHYDLGNDFYAAWLDAGMTYSSAMFDGDASLEQAQDAKIRALLGRLELKPGQHLLEIGCGWGSLAEVAAKDYGVFVTGLTLSQAQKDYADARMARLGLSDQVTIKLLDYRDEEGDFDAIASVEMVEAVGQKYWPHYLAAIKKRLKPGGCAAVQYISIADDIFKGYAANADFIQTYIFPGGMLLSDSRFRTLAERTGLAWEDERRFGKDYARTLRLWRLRFDEAVSLDRLPKGFDQEFIDLWRFYLMYCEGGFLSGGIDVAQVTLRNDK